MGDIRENSVYLENLLKNIQLTLKSLERQIIKDKLIDSSFTSKTNTSSLTI